MAIRRARDGRLDDNGWARADQEWRDPSNWRGGFLGIYVAPKDPRTLVRKKYQPMGWTFNFAHPAGWYAMLGLVLTSVALVALLIWFDV